MTAEEKIFKVLEKIKGDIDISPAGSVIVYRVGQISEVKKENERLILQKLEEEGAISIIESYGNDSYA